MKKRIPALFLALLFIVLSFPLAAFAAPSETGEPVPDVTVTPTAISVPETEGQEFSIDGGSTWQTSGTFTGLTPDTEYSITTRYAETEDTMPSAASAPLVVRTKIASASVPVPTMPELVSRTATQVVVSTEDGNEYSIDGGLTWQSGGTFGGLTPGEEYEIVSRVKETETSMPSGSSPALTVSTKASAPSAPTEAPSIVKKTDTAIIVETAAGLEYSIDGGFSWQDSGTFDGLTPGKGYEIVSRVKETETSMPSENSPALTVSTKASAPAAPAAPVLESRTDTEIKVKAVEGQEYTIDSGESWQESSAFQGLAASTSYKIAARTAETDSVMPSPMSDELEVSTRAKEDPSHDSIYTKVEDHKAYASGYPDGTIRPEQEITREEAAQLLFKVMGVENSEQKDSFTDVSSARWSYPAVSALSQHGVIFGYGDGTFRPEQEITRAEFVSMVSRWKPGVGSETVSFPDAAGHWAQNAIENAASNGWIAGYEDGTFKPEQPITRAEAFAVLNRALGRKLKEKDGLNDSVRHWPDVDPDAWYYLDVAEATTDHTGFITADVESWRK